MVDLFGRLIRRDGLRDATRKGSVGAGSSASFYPRVPLCIHSIKFFEVIIVFVAMVTDDDENGGDDDDG